jgi:hypothetical protein
MCCWRRGGCPGDTVVGDWSANGAYYGDSGESRVES